MYTQNHEPIPSMYGISNYLYLKNQPNVGKYTIHGCYRKVLPVVQINGEPLGYKYFTKPRKLIGVCGTKDLESKFPGHTINN